MDPLVTILMPAHNEERYLSEALASVFSQTYERWELVVVDDHSTDGTADILGATTDPRVRVIRAPGKFPDLGSVLNFGLQAVHGDLIARLDADDRCYPHRLSEQVAFLQEHQEVVLVGSSADAIDEHGTFISTSATPTDDVAIRWQLNYRNPIHHPSVLMRRDAVEGVGGYDQDMHHAEDYELFRCLGELGRLHSLPEPLIAKRSHAVSVSVANQQRQDEVATVISRRVLGGRISTPVSDELIAALRWRQFASPDQLEEAADFLVDLYRGMRREATFRDPARARALSREAVNAVLTLSRTPAKHLRARRHRWKAFLVSPMEASQVAVGALGRRMKVHAE